MLFSAQIASLYPLYRSVILDSSATIHIFNNIAWFLNYCHALPDDFLHTGDTTVLISGYREVDIELISPEGNMILCLYDMAFCRNFACNVISLRQLRKRGYYWDNYPPYNRLYRKDRSVIYELQDCHGQFVIEYNTPEKSAFSLYCHCITLWTERAPNTGIEILWHLRLGHPGPEVLNHLPGYSQGV